MTAGECPSVDVAIIGGGIAGLAAAFAAHRAGRSVVLLEASDRVGGKIASAEVAGGAVDVGPDSFLARVPWAIELCAELGMAADLVEPATGQAWLWTRGRLRPLPAGLVLGVPSRLLPLARAGVLSWTGLARAALPGTMSGRLTGRRRYQVPEDPSVAEAIGRHLGRQVVDQLVDPLLGGINAGDSDRLSLGAAAPALVEATGSTGLMRALRARPPMATIGPVFLAPRIGMTGLTSRLTASLPEGVIRLGTPVDRISPADNGWLVGSYARARRVIVATPAWIAASLLRPHHAEIADELDAIVYSSVALTVLAYRRNDARLPPGSGMLVPRREGRLLTAASWYDQKWPNQARPDHVLIRASAGRLGDDRAMRLDDANLAACLHEELRVAIPSIASAPVDSVVTRWPRAFPQYEPGHGARVDRIMAGLPRGISLAGAAYRGVGLAACIREGLAAGRRE